MRINAKSCSGVELWSALKKKKMDKLRFLVPLGLAFKRSFAGFTTVLLDVESLVEQVGEG